MDKTNLKQRHQTWYARLTVPPSLRAAVGKSEIVRSLKTRDLREANRLKHRVLADLQSELARIAAEATLPKDSAEYVLAVARAEREAVEKGRQTMEQADAALDATMERFFDAEVAKRGMDPETGYPLLEEAKERTVQLALRVLHSGNVVLLSESVKTYLEETRVRVNRQTIKEKERHLKEFAEWLRGDCDVGSINRKTCGRYLTERLMRKGHAPKTVRDTLSNLSAYFEWAVLRGHSEFNPWRGLSKSVRESSRGTQPKRRPWTDEELLKLLQGIRKDDPLWAMSAIAAYTGMRREEIAQLRTDDVHGEEALIIRQGKNQNSVRFVPIHDALRPLILQLKRSSSDGYLIPGLLTGGDDAKRGHYIGKRFTEARRKLGLSAPDTVFHSFRKALAQRCENAGVPESTTKLIGGWSRSSSMAYGKYSPGPDFKALLEAIQKATYGKADELVREAGASVVISRKSRRRRWAPQQSKGRHSLS